MSATHNPNIVCPTFSAYERCILCVQITTYNEHICNSKVPRVHQKEAFIPCDLQWGKRTGYGWYKGDATCGRDEISWLLIPELSCVHPLGGVFCLPTSSSAFPPQSASPIGGPK